VDNAYGTISLFLPCSASFNFPTSIRACARRKKALTFFGDKLRAVVQSRSASWYLECAREIDVSKQKSFEDIKKSPLGELEIGCGAI
jgi:hypothetical protein